MSLFKKAVKSDSKLRMAIAGPSGSGKTYTALAIASALVPGGKVAVVDTEHGSASKYADIFNFDVAEMHEPFHPEKYGSAIADAADAGYDVIILDSTSHAWSGTGGVLSIVEEAGKRARGNSYVGWAEGTPAQNALVESITSAGLHVIATMRSKQDYIMVEKRGKQVPQKVGMAPVQRDGFEYEFDVVLDMDIDNNGIVGKTRCPELNGKVFAKPGADVAEILADWLRGAPVEKPEPESVAVVKSLPESLADGHPDTAAGMGTPEDNPFDTDPAAEPVPSDGDQDIISQWRGPVDAQNWMVENGMNTNAHSARESWKKAVVACSGYSAANKMEVFAAYLAERQENAANAESTS